MRYILRDGSPVGVGKVRFTSRFFLQQPKKMKTSAGLIFGLVFFVHAMNREDKWIVGRFEKDGQQIKSLTYFRPQV